MNILAVPLHAAQMTPEETLVRRDLAALYRVVAHFRMTDHIYTHISAAVPGQPGSFLINKYGVMFHEMRPEHLVKIDIDGNVVESRSDAPQVNRAGFVIHSAIHRVRRDMKFVIHTHTSAGIAVSAQKHGLLPISQHALHFHDHLAYHDYEGVALDLDEQERLVKDLGHRHAMILRNHGLLVGGRTAAEAFSRIYTLERACQIQVQALSGGLDAINFPADAVRERTASQTNLTEIPDYMDLAWDAALRLVESGSQPSQ